MNLVNFLLKKHLVITSLIVSFVISSIIWLSIGWVSYFNGREQEIEIETDIIFDIVTDIIKHDKKLVKETILPLNNDSELDFVNSFLTNINKNNILLNNSLFSSNNPNNLINLYSYDYANKRLKYFNNLYTKHWIEVRDSKNNILIQTKYKNNVAWDDKYYEAKKNKENGLYR